jgi:hypothetical protein
VFAQLCERSAVLEPELDAGRAVVKSDLVTGNSQAEVTSQPFLNGLRLANEQPVTETVKRRKRLVRYVVHDSPELVHRRLFGLRVGTVSFAKVGPVTGVLVVVTATGAGHRLIVR